MEVWLFFGMIIAGVVVYNIIGDKVNYEKRAIADAATAKKVKQENKNLELHNQKEELYEKTALIDNLIKKADKSIQSEAKTPPCRSERRSAAPGNEDLGGISAASRRYLGYISRLGRADRKLGDGAGEHADTDGRL